ncbi:MAG: acyl-ACP thioesterase [Alistipes sp.]|nr:acyl-ACP thioesterase [Alistipes sp.]
MADKTLYDIRVEPQDVDFTLRATLASLGGSILNIAGTDAQTKGFGVDVLGRSNLSWVLSRFAMEFDSRPEQYGSYVIATWISDYNRLMSTRNFTLTGSDGRIFGRAVSQWCMLDLTTRTAVDMTSTAGMHAQWIVDAPPPAERPRKIGPLGDAALTSEHRVAYSDIDFNRHMNTMRYIELMLDMLPVDLVASDRGVRFDVNFLRESRYGQMLTLGCAEQDGEWRFAVSADGAECLRAAISFAV